MDLVTELVSVTKIRAGRPGNRGLISGMSKKVFLETPIAALKNDLAPYSVAVGGGGAGFPHWSKAAGA
jgi:hypothetical protein